MTDLRDDQTLIFDADDTLWECNRYFEEVIDEFLGALAHVDHTREQIREILDAFERQNGYGTRAFATSLVQTVRHIDPEASDGTLADIERLGMRLMTMELAPIDGVADTIDALTPYHRLLLFTKGEEEEQRLKLERAPIASRFELHIVTDDKTVETYADVVDSLGLDPERTWMIGNSLRSDVQPALQAGIGAVFVPNPHTWHMEHVDFEHHPDWVARYIETETIRDLTRHFRHD